MPPVIALSASPTHPGVTSADLRLVYSEPGPAASGACSPLNPKWHSLALAVHSESWILWTKHKGQLVKHYKSTLPSRTSFTIFYHVMCLYLLIHLSLHLDNLVLHTGIELLKMFCRASLDLKLFQLAFSKHASVCALDGDRSSTRAIEFPPLQPATDIFLNDNGPVVLKKLEKRRSVRLWKAFENIPFEMETFCFKLSNEQIKCVMCSLWRNENRSEWE